MCAWVRVSVRAGRVGAVQWSITWLLSNCNWNKWLICDLRFQQPKFNPKSFKAVWVAGWWLNHFQKFTLLFSFQCLMCWKSGSCKMMSESTKQFWLGWKESWGLAGKEEKRSSLSPELWEIGRMELFHHGGWVTSHLLNLFLYYAASLWKCKTQLFSSLGRGEAGEWIWTLHSPWSVLVPLL